MTTTAPLHRPGRKKHEAPPSRTCASCGVDFRPMNARAEFCSTDCRRAAWKERARTGRVASVRRLKSSAMSVVIHMDSDIQLAPGDRVRVGEEV